jgi:hypothetical protein
VFAFAQLGRRLGARVSETFREPAEQIAGLALLGHAALLVIGGDITTGGTRGKNGKDQRSFAFAQAFGGGTDFAQP